MTTAANKDAEAAKVEALSSFLREADAETNARTEVEVHADAGQLLCALIDSGLDRLALPGAGAGQTLQRWRALSAVAAHDLSLVKLYEGHTDALAILAEAGVDIAPPLSVWGTWCAEPPQARLQIAAVAAEGAGKVILNGVKAWCSGAEVLTHAVVSGWNADGESCLAAVDLDQPGVTISDDRWHAVGMAQTRSVQVRFDQAQGVAVGAPGFYTGRSGFWHGGAGIAACWHGAAAALAGYLRRHLQGRDDPHALAHLGHADVALSAAAAALRAAAQFIDDAPAADCYRTAMRVRLAAEQAANVVIYAAGRAMGAAPLCQDPWFARMMADLPVYLRQSHAERDLAALAQSDLQHGETAGVDEWRL